MAEYIEREAAVMRLMQDGCSAKNVQTIMALPAVAIPQWISVKERLPRNYIEVMVFDAIDRSIFLGAIGYSGEWEIPGFRTCRFNITHWMPLPEPPKGEAE